MSDIKGIQNPVVSLLGKIGKLTLMETPPSNAGIAANLLLENDEWTKSVNGKVVNGINVQNDDPTKESFWVKLPKPEISKNKVFGEQQPDNKIAKQIRETLLRDELGFETEDIKEFDRLTKNNGFYINDSKSKNKWATSKEIGKWETKDGYVKVDVSNERIDVLRNFRFRRILGDSLEGLKDPLLRETVENDLRNIYIGKGSEKTLAAEHLMSLEVTDHDDVELIQNTVRMLSQQKESKNNAVLQTVAVIADLKKALNDRQNAFNVMVNSPGNYEKSPEYLKHQANAVIYETRLQRTMDAAGGIDAQSGRRSRKADRTEAAWANRQLAEVFNRMDEPDRAREREMVSRYYNLDDKDRNSLDFRSGKPRVAIDGTIYGGGFFKIDKHDMIEPTYRDPIVNAEPPRKEFGEDPFKRGLDKTETRYKVFEQRTNGNKMQVNTQEGKFVGYEENYVVEGSLRTTEGKATTTKESQTKFENKRQRNEIKTQKTITTTQRGAELNPRGIGRVAAANGAQVAADTFNLWFPILVDNYVTHKSLNDRLLQEKTDKAIFFRDNYPVPPEPKDLSKIRLRFEREYGKQKAAVIMKGIEEISYATYGK